MATPGDTLPSSTLVVCTYGQQRRLDDSSAFYNAQEAETLVSLLESLLAEQAALAAPGAAAAPVSSGDVGVICLSRAQVVHVRNLLRHKALGDVNVGTVDDFQGQELRVTFISTVLSAPVRAAACLRSACRLGARVGDGADVRC